ncbi:hypothetical protein GCM10010464_27190 [Pseudonocardia yunnanensis]|uniref:DUF7002 family protein n=1 Tax=Pseudonocardia yunnanensis TaxID=58107 RepID=A0ABW4F3C8_9PSEU
MNVPDTLSASYIAVRWPRLYHMTEAGSWSSVKRHGLLSTTALLDLFEVSGPDRDRIEASRRGHPVVIEHPEHGRAVIHDNRPINVNVLRRALVGMSEPEWYRTLNRRVFFWLTEKRLDTLCAAPSNRGRLHDILIFDTSAVLEAYASDVELTHLNAGAVRTTLHPRGAETFRSIADYPWSQRSRIARSEPIVELTLPRSLPDPADFVVEVQTR